MAVEEQELVGVLGQTAMSEIGHDLLRSAVVLLSAPCRWQHKQCDRKALSPKAPLASVAALVVEAEDGVIPHKSLPTG